MRNHSNRLLKRLMIVFAGIIAVFGLSGCTKSFCNNQDKANQLFAYYGNLYNSTQTLDESLTDDFDYLADDEDRSKLIQLQNTHRNTLFSSFTSTNGMTNWYELRSSTEGKEDFLSFMDTKAKEFSDTNYKLWMDNTIDDMTDEKQAKAVAWHVGIYAGVEDGKVTELWTNFDTWYAEAVEKLGILAVPSATFVSSLKSSAATGYSSNTACITPESGVFNQNYSKVYIEGKTWGQAFKEYGFLEGLLVYPLSWIVHTISESMGDTGWAQILAIAVVTIMVRLVTVISTIFQSRSQAKQQKIQPLLNELNKKYPNSQTDREERQALAMEQAQIMKKNKVHPMLPMLFMIIQFPLFICVWSALQGSASLASGNWYGLSLTTKVSQCFTNYSGTSGALVGIFIFIFMTIANILSSCTGLWMNTWRTKNFGNIGMQQQKTDANGNPVDPNKTMKIMTYVMMAFVIIMGWSLPAGMGIYWFIGAIVSIFQSLLTEYLQARSRRKDAANTGDGSTLAAIRRSSRHTGTASNKNKSNKPLWRK